jgi:hypothetical protein
VSLVSLAYRMELGAVGGKAHRSVWLGAPGETVTAHGSSVIFCSARRFVRPEVGKRQEPPPFAQVRLDEIRPLPRRD